MPELCHHKVHSSTHHIFSKHQSVTSTSYGATKLVYDCTMTNRVADRYPLSLHHNSLSFGGRFGWKCANLVPFLNTMASHPAK